MLGRREAFLIALAWPLLLGSVVNGQGYGNLDDDSGNSGVQQQIPANQQTNNLPQYENPAAGPQPQQQGPQGNSATQPQGQSNNPQMWWQGQNAFQRPPGHPGVQPLGSANNAPSSQAPQRPSFNAQGAGSGWQGPQQQQQQQQQQPSQPAPQYQNAPSQQYNNPPPTSQGPSPQQFNPAGNGQPPPQQGPPQYNNPGPQQAPPQYNNPAPQQAPPQYNNPASQQAPPQYNNPAPQQAPPQYNNPAPQQGAPQYNNQGPQQTSQQYNNPAPQQAPPQYNNPQGGWNSPAPPQQYQPQGQGFGQPESAPGCELVNKADCHKRDNYNSAPPQNYQPPPIDPQPYPEQPPYNPPQQQQSIPQPNLGYQPPPQQEPNNYLPQPSYNPDPSNPSQPQPYQPPPQSQPQPQRPPTQPSPQPQRPPTQPQPRPQPYQPPQAPRPRPAPQQNQRPPAPEEAPVPYPGCPAAMLCVQDDYCNMIGLIEENPVQLSAAEKLHRVALMECSEPMTGIVGKCCRDPNYVDPWPDMNGNGMPKKMMNGGGHHHPKTPAQGQKSPNFQPQQPPQGNHLAAGNGAANPYSEILKITRNSNRGTKSILGPSPPPSHYSESKQTLQVLEPCFSDELCISMSQCHSLNPDFMARTGLNPKTKMPEMTVRFGNRHNSNESAVAPTKIKRCKYERSGIHYLCCKKPVVFPTTSTARPFFSSTLPKHLSRFTTTQQMESSTTPSRTKSLLQSSLSTSSYSSTPTPVSSYKPFHLPSPIPTINSSLITGVGLRFHSGLHSEKQREINRNKPNPYRENEDPIVLLTSPMTIRVEPFRPTVPTIEGSSASSKEPKIYRFRFTMSTASLSSSPTTTVPPPTSLRITGGASSPFSDSTSNAPRTISTLAKVIGTRKSFSSTTPSYSPSFSSQHGTTTPIRTSLPTSESSPASDATTTKESTTTTTTTTEGKVDITKIPEVIPLFGQFKENPPIGFIFKGEDLFIPEIQVPSQNFLLPSNDFEERTFPPEEEDEEYSDNAPTTQFGGEEDVTTIYSLLDEPSNNSASEDER